MKMAIIGSRDFPDTNFAKSTIQRLIIMNIPEIDDKDKEFIIISGGADGIDTLAEIMADSYRVEKKIFKANWNDLSQPDAVLKTNKFGKKYDAMAGKRRNTLIIEEADYVIAFWDGKSSGTKDSINKALKMGKPIDIYVR